MCTVDSYRFMNAVLLEKQREMVSKNESAIAEIRRLEGEVERLKLLLNQRRRIQLRDEHREAKCEESSWLLSR